MNQELLDKVHSRGYWRVVVRPTDYQKNRIESLTKCYQLVQDATVRLRGWDYPHTEANALIYGQDYVESSSEFGSNKEIWRIYQSGQFVHHKAMIEDWQEEDIRLFGGQSRALGFKGIDLINTLYCITEIVEFITRIATKNVLGNSVNIRIELHDTNNRRLFSWGNRRYISANRICDIPEIVIEQKYDVLSITAKSAEISMGMTLFVLERFKLSITAEVLKEEQEKFLKGLI